MQRAKQSFTTTPICQFACDPELSLQGRVTLDIIVIFPVDIAAWLLKRGLTLKHEEFQVRRQKTPLQTTDSILHKPPESCQVPSASLEPWARAKTVLALPTKTALPAPSLLALAQAHPVRGGWEHAGNALPAITSSGEQGLRHSDGSVGIWCWANIVNDRQCLKKLPVLNEQAKLLLAIS